MREYSPEQVQEIRNALPPGFLEQVVKAEVEKRKVPARPDRPQSQPAVGRYAAVKSGQHKRVARPQATADDRAYVPGALKHWRRVHGLTQRAAQAKVGYSPASCSWNHWEAGYFCPPYRTLLKIILCTGLGYWTDPSSDAQLDPDLRMEMARGRR